MAGYHTGSESIERLLTQLNEVLLQETLLDLGPMKKTDDPPVQISSPIASYIDHTLLKLDAASAEIARLCEEAKHYGFASVCVHSSYVSLCAERLSGSDVMVCTVVGFPLGASSSQAKAFEARWAAQQGAHEVDMVIHLGALKEKQYAYVLSDIQTVVQAAKPAKVKVILETGELSSEEKVIAALLSKLAGAHFVKTSTGFGKGGATAEDIALLRRIVGSEMGVKASGGIRTREDAERMLLAGANRLGTSGSIRILNEPSLSKLPEATVSNTEEY